MEGMPNLAATYLCATNEVGNDFVVVQAAVPVVLVRVEVAPAHFTLHVPAGRGKSEGAAREGRGKGRDTVCMVGRWR